MHIITGLILAAMAGRKKKSGQGGAPLLKSGPVRTEHVLPGRLRLRVPSLAGDPEGCRNLAARFSNLQGIQAAEANPVTGSVLVHYDEQVVRPELIFGAVVKLLGLEEELERVPTPVLTRELGLLGRSLNRAVYEKSGGLINGWSLLLLSLAALGIRQALNDNTRAWPAGLTMVWWAVNGLGRG
jgi:hypothetical protein